MGLFDSLEKKFDELKKDIGFGDSKQQQRPPQAYPSGQQPYYPPPQQQTWGPPPQQQQWGQPPPQQYQRQYQQQQYPQPNSPIPQKQQQPQQQPPGEAPPRPSGNPTDYWTPILHASRSVSTDFDHKIGNGDNGWGNSELQHYTASPSNSLYTPDHKLMIRAISRPSDPNPSTRYTSARLVSRQRLDRSRGCLTATITNPSAPGIWPAFWLLPSEPFGWPHEGEVDVGESWNGEHTNHTCLHWGHFTPEDGWKHRVIDTPIPDLPRRAVKYEFAWEQDEGSGKGRYMWWIDGRAVMKCDIPEGFRRMREWTVLLNVAMGGNVCQGKTPKEGEYVMVVHELRLSGECDGGWGRFEADWWRAPQGRTM